MIVKSSVPFKSRVEDNMKTGKNAGYQHFFFLYSQFLTANFPLTRRQNFCLSQTEKACADNKSNITQIIKIVLYRAENIAGKGENTGDQHFFLYPQCFFPLNKRQNFSLVQIESHYRQQIKYHSHYQICPI